MNPRESGFSYWRLLREFPEFRRLYLARTVSLLGDWFSLIALLALLRESGDEGGASAALFIVKLLPNFLAGFPAGVVADRFSRRTIMLVSDLVRFPAVLLIFTAPLFPGSAVLIVLGCSLITAVASAFFEPARGAALPLLVSREHLARANELGALTWSLVFALGSGVGGVATEFLGWRVALLLDALTFLISAAFILKLKIPPTPRVARDRSRGIDWAEVTGLRAIHEAYVYVRGRVDVAAVMFIKTGWALAGGITFLLTLYGRDRYHFDVGPDFGTAVLFVSRAAGTGLGPPLFRRIFGETPRAMGLAVGLAFVVGAVFYIAFAFVQNAWLACLFVFIAHLGGSVVWVFSTVLLQQTVRNDFLGRVTAADFGTATLMFCVSILYYRNFLSLPGMTLDDASLSIGLSLFLPAAVWMFYGRHAALRTAESENES